MTQKSVLDSAPKDSLPDEKIAYVVERITAGTDDDLRQINGLIARYRFSSPVVAEILRDAPINALLKINVDVLHPKVIVRTIKTCVNVINMSNDAALIAKCQRILEFACDRLYYINFGHDELLELADIDHNRVSEYLTSMSNDYSLHAKIIISEENANQVVHVLQSNEPKKLSILNAMIDEFRFSHDRLASILIKTPLEALEKLDTSLLKAKMIIRVIACCVQEIKWNRDQALGDRFRRIFDIAFQRLKDRTLSKEEMLELARIADKRVLELASMSNHIVVQELAMETAMLAGIRLNS